MRRPSCSEINVIVRSNAGAAALAPLQPFGRLPVQPSKAIVPLAIRRPCESSSKRAAPGRWVFEAQAERLARTQHAVEFHHLELTGAARAAPLASAIACSASSSSTTPGTIGFPWKMAGKCQVIGGDRELETTRQTLALG